MLRCLNITQYITLERCIYIQSLGLTIFVDNGRNITVDIDIQEVETNMYMNSYNIVKRLNDGEYEEIIKDDRSGNKLASKVLYQLDLLHRCPEDPSFRSMFEKAYLAYLDYKNSDN
ncbi:hypothetical protein LN736_16885 [Clostridium sp. WLY-B-L2]|uniref:Uncharacterized protein n=1 Tax=Clostridium aromativorans TaxID=2836848 RepID=A0ABS8N9L9_9CLOT|nr:hypothetical protein [Clostridium aromativorans]MCC9296522.1 hypothetical protein [Clostridium aromativorans]